MATGWLGSPGTIPTCRGTAPCCISPNIGPDGAPAGARVIAGGVAESIFQPEWSPDGDEVIFVSDRTGWWNLYAYEVAAGTHPSAVPHGGGVRRAAMEFRHVNLRLRRRRANPVRLHEGRARATGAARHRVRVAAGRSRPDLRNSARSAPTATKRRVSRRRAGPADRDRHILICGPGKHRILKQATDLLDRADRASSTTDQGRAGGISDLRRQDGIRPVLSAAQPGLRRAGTDEKPPLLVKCHGGPTSSASSALSLAIQFWTSRGIAVLDVNYGGSTGFGREYRERLKLNWGIVDVDDCVNGAKFFAAAGVGGRQARRDQRRQRRRLYDAGGAGLPRFLSRRRQLLRRERCRSTWPAIPTNSSRVISTG